MSEWLMEAAAWVRNHEGLVRWAVGGSAALFVGTLIAVPIAVARIPPDYFVPSPGRRAPVLIRAPWLRVPFLAVKNLVGLVLLLIGVIMLVTPGQGLLTMAIGVILLNFPGKRALERKVVGLRSVARAIAWIRHKAGVPPLSGVNEPARQNANVAGEGLHPHSRL